MMFTLRTSLLRGSTIAALLLVSSFAFAREGTSSGGGVGPVGTYADCTGELNDGTPVSFQVRATAVPTFIDAVLVETETNELIIQLSCVRGDDIVPGTPSAGQVEWVCSEYQHVDDGDISVRLERGGVTGVVTGKILQKQMFPLKPKQMGRLICK